MSGDNVVRQFRQILLWPLQLLPLDPESQIQRYWEVLDAGGAGCPWRPVKDRFTAGPAQFQEHHYSEFVTFLPYVQRFLYGEGRELPASSLRPQQHDPGASSMRVFRREDIAAVRVTIDAGDAPILLRIAHVDLMFFYDIDVVLLNIEVYADELTLTQAQEIMYRFGRSYPTGWDENGQGAHAMHCVEWLDAGGRVLATSDLNDSKRFLAFVGEHRAPRFGSHWAYVLEPLLPEYMGVQGLMRYRQLQYHRMPLMAYLAVDDPRTLTRADFVRLGLATGPGEGLPYSETHLADFEARHCYDGFWCETGQAPMTRYLCCGHALVVVGDARVPFFVDEKRGVLGQFRRQHFLLFLIAHFQRAALLMFSDRLADVLRQLHIGDPDRVRRFKRAIRRYFEIFLRFTHRYWFHEVSERAHAKALFELCASHLRLDRLYDEVKQEITDMTAYLETDSVRRQANTVVRLTVVTVFGLIGTVATGFLGMNLLAEADRPLPLRIFYFLLVMVGATALTFYAVVKSKRMSDFLDALSDEGLSARAKLAALMDVWRKHARY